MQPFLQEFDPQRSPESVAAGLGPGCEPVLLRSRGAPSSHCRYSLLAAFPMLGFESRGAHCTWSNPQTAATTVQFGNPWQLLSARLALYEMVDQLDHPFPLGGCFGYWGYDLKQFVEPRVGRIAVNDLELPDCRIGFHPSLLVWDHQLGRAWIVATGLQIDGSRCPREARRQVERWQAQLDLPERTPARGSDSPPSPPAVSMSETQFIAAVQAALDYIRAGDIYQVNLSRRWTQWIGVEPWHLFEHLDGLSPAPFSGFHWWPETAIVSSSPEQFLRISGRQILTRPIKGTRPRGNRPDEDARFAYELQSSEKERAELVMITDLLRNDLGRICDFGSISVPDMLRLEKFSHVQHLISTVTGRLRPEHTHLDALASCFPGGSITGAPKIRAMQIIDELEPVSRGPYTGCLGYAGFNRESQWNILIRTAVVQAGRVHYHAGAGIVADSDPAAELEETHVKARAFFQAIAGITRSRAGSAGPGTPFENSSRP